jgi:sterol desaturase/sphingolipid hydroxylase (fatty acid hydroxylase superfamily)
MNSEILRSASLVLTAGALVILLVLESIRPLRKLRRPRPGRYLVNAAITGLGLFTGAMVVRPVAISLSVHFSANSPGVLNVMGLPVWARFAAGFLLMDLTFYYWHRLNHEVPLLWRFHSVHHIDPDMDVTTSMRFHFGEVFLSTFFRAGQVVLLGITPLTYLVYEMVFTLATMFHHSNLQLPLDMEKSINRLLVTPRMHSIHHSVVRSELNSNYSVIFRWWDDLNRSLVLNVPQSAITTGVGRYQRTVDNGVWRLLTLPFGHFPRERAPRTPRFGEAGLTTMAE